MPNWLCFLLVKNLKLLIWFYVQTQNFLQMQNMWPYLRSLELPLLIKYWLQHLNENAFLSQLAFPKCCRVNINDPKVKQSSSVALVINFNSFCQKQDIGGLLLWIVLKQFQLDQPKWCKLALDNKPYSLLNFSLFLSHG